MFRRASPRHRANRLQDRLVHLLWVEPKPSGVCFHDGDPANQSFAPLTLFLNLFRQLADLAFEVILLDCGAGDERRYSADARIWRWRRSIIAS